MITYGGEPVVWQRVSKPDSVLDSNPIVFKLKEPVMQSLRKSVVVLVGVLAIVALAQDSYAATNPLPKQTVELTVPQPKPTADLSFSPGYGAYYHPGLKIWGLIEGGDQEAHFDLNLNLSKQINVALTLEMNQYAQTYRDYFTMAIQVNGDTLIAGYQEPVQLTLHPLHARTWYIPSTMLRAGSNTIRVTLDTFHDFARTAVYWFKSATVENFVSSTLPNALPPRADLQQAAMFA